MQVFFAFIVLVVLFSLLWLIKQLHEIGAGMGQLNGKFDSLIVLLERIEKNTENTSHFLSEESEAYQQWKHELDAAESE